MTLFNTLYGILIRIIFKNVLINCIVNSNCSPESHYQVVCSNGFTCICLRVTLLSIKSMIYNTIDWFKETFNGKLNKCSMICSPHSINAV